MERYVFNKNFVFTHSINITPFDSYPVNSTEIAPPELNSGEFAVFNGAGWEVAGNQNREAMKARLAAYRYDQETAGIRLNGVDIETGREAQILITNLKMMVTEDPGYTVRFKSADGQIIDADASYIHLLYAAVVGYVQACRTKEADLIQAIDQSDETSLSSIELYSGWPERNILA